MTDLTATPRAASHGGAGLAGWTAAVGSSVALSTAPVIGKAILKTGLQPTELLVLRLWITSALLLATVALTTGLGSLRLDRRGLLASAIGGLSNGAAVLLFFLSLALQDASISALLYALYPLAVLGLLALRGEKFTNRNLARLALGLGGVYVLIGRPEPGALVSWLGVVVVLLSAAGAALHSALTQWYLQGFNALTVTLYTVVFMTVAVTGLWLAQGAPWQAPTPAAWAGIVALALVPTYLARLWMFAGIRRLGSARVALLGPLETLLTVAWSVLFLAERLSLPQWAGSVLILISAGLATARLRRPPAARPRARGGAARSDR